MYEYLKDIRIPLAKIKLTAIVLVAALVFAGSQLVVKAVSEDEGSSNPVTNQTVEIIKGIQTGSTTTETEKPAEEKPEEETPAPAPVQPEEQPVVEDVTTEETTEAVPNTPTPDTQNGSIPTTGPKETLIAVVAIVAIGFTAKYFIKSKLELRSSALRSKN
jgi:type IV secretory pathway VirB2 component (pilin)